MSAPVATAASAQLDLLQADAPQDPELTVLSFGAGQDSTALLYRYFYDPAFRTRYAPRAFLVLCADSGDEHPATVAHIRRVQDLCRDHQVAFEYITLERGYHRGSWAGGIVRHFETHNTIGSVSYPKTCTVNLKVEPIYRFLEEWVGQRYELPTGGKRALRGFAARHGKIRMLIGIAAGEERRVAKAGTSPPWMQAAIDRVYPLIDLGMDRAACQAYIASVGQPIPPWSACFVCPYKQGAELLWSARRFPDRWERWVQAERRKLDAWEGRTKRNLGVKGAIALPEALARAERQFGHLSDEELDTYAMSHGHCVATTY